MGPSATSPVSWSRAVAIFAVAFALLSIHAATFLPFFCDDSLISLRYSDRLIHGLGLTWTDGERVEGYSNLLFVLVCAGLGGLGMDLIAAARLVGFLGMGAAIAVPLALYPPRRGQPWLPAAVGPMAIAVAPPIALWTIGGLAPPMVVALLGWATVAAIFAIERPDHRRAWALTSGLLLAALSLTRVDGPLFVVTTVLGVLLVMGRRSDGIKLAAWIAIPPLLAYGGQFLFRYSYYGEWVPNTAHVKAEPSLERITQGLLDYTLPAAGYLIGAVGLGFVGLVGTLRGGIPRARGVLPLTAVILWTAYITFVGGDYMPAWRHHCASLVMSAMLAAGAAAWLVRRDPGSPWWQGLWATPFLLVLLLGQLVDERIRYARFERWEWEAQPVADMLVEAFGEQRPYVAVEAAGCLPYFSRLPALDMLGLTDHHIARQDAHTELPIGHDHGDGVYVLDRQPDLVVFGFYGLSLRSGYVSAVEMFLDPRFARRYRAASFETALPQQRRVKMWLRTEGRIGIRLEEDAVEVPGYLFGNLDLMRLDQAAPNVAVESWEEHPPVVARVVDGAMVTELETTERVFVHGVELAAGAWRLELEGATPGLLAGVVDAESGRELGVRFVIEGAAKRVDLWVQAPEGASGSLGAVRLVRGGR